MKGLILSIGAIALGLWPLIATFGAAIFDFLFCPIHGIFAPQNWAALAPVIQPVTSNANMVWQKAVSVCRMTKNKK